jgi:ParB-like chromosome segregation protein Spo0J
MQQININELKAHPKNDYFFDDIRDENWTTFLESVKTSGVIEPIVVTQDKIIVSGHQRTRACKELGIQSIMCEIRIYDDDNKILKDLLETNLRQRGIGNTNPVKLGRCILELEKIYGISKGNNQFSLPNNSASSQSALADMIGVSVDTIQNYKKLTQLIPELVDLIDTGIVTPTTATAIAKNMSQEKQEEFINSMDITKKLTQKEVQQYIQKIKQLESQPPTIIEKEVEIDNTDYTTLENKKNELAQLQKKYDLQSEKIDILNERAAIFEENSEKYKNLTNEIENLTKDKSDIARRIVAVTSVSGLAEKISFFLKTELAPIKYSKALQETKNDEIVTKNLSDIVYGVQCWCNEMLTYLPKDDKNNVIDMEDK